MSTAATRWTKPDERPAASAFCFKGTSSLADGMSGLGAVPSDRDARKVKNYGVLEMLLASGVGPMQILRAGMFIRASCRGKPEPRAGPQGRNDQPGGRE